jgi:hypothetical protein
MKPYQYAQCLVYGTGAGALVACCGESIPVMLTFFGLNMLAFIAFIILINKDEKDLFG